MQATERQALRQLIRQYRRAVPAEKNRQDSSSICDQLINSLAYQASTHIALFLAADGELDVSAVASRAVADGKQCYLPVSLMDGSWQLEFHPWTPGAPLFRTQLGVLEPERHGQARNPADLDLVLTPLVAFDPDCYRMGMGKGFYDRTFAFRRGDSKGVQANSTETEHPWLVGIAHGCQLVEDLEPNWWDVPLDAVITPEQIYGERRLLEIVA